MPEPHLTPEEALRQAESLATGSKWHRLAKAPGKYLSAQVFRWLIYPLGKKSWTRRALTFFGSPMYVLLPAGIDIFLTGCKTHHSEIRLAKFMLQQIKTGDTVVDVGAHFGFFTLLAAACCDVKGRVFAFEPGRQTFEILSKNTAPFPQIQIEPQAVGATNGTLDFWEFPTLYSEYNTTNRDAVPAHIQGNMRQMSVVTLDTYCGEHQIMPDFIKMDVEGAELEVIKGMEALLTGHHPPVIAMEYLGKDSHRQAQLYLNDRGFKTYIISAEGTLVPCADADQYLQNHGLDSENLVFLRILSS